ncbi:unnamed protein product [Nezara viridula]|uniref:Uncharacterized protein n=1 Tax=Nezara viridula TaxID=85310 RepID=A0A9P0H380_NEZVI|nr:unnamed protein product [Nezara viridula]
MEVTSIGNEEIQLAGNLKYVQFKSDLKNLIEREILADGWQSSAEAFDKIFPKKRYLPSFKKAFHGAILAGFEESLDEMLGDVLPKQWDILYQEKYDNHHDGKDTSRLTYSKMALNDLKLKQKAAVESVIELKLKKIEEIKQSIYIKKLEVIKKSSELQAIKQKWKKNCGILEDLKKMSF